jgi:hypothetical protein
MATCAGGMAATIRSEPSPTRIVRPSARLAQSEARRSMRRIAARWSRRSAARLDPHRPMRSQQCAEFRRLRPADLSPRAIDVSVARFPPRDRSQRAVVASSSGASNDAVLRRKAQRKKEIISSWVGPYQCHHELFPDDRSICRHARQNSGPPGAACSDAKIKKLSLNR